MENLGTLLFQEPSEFAFECQTILNRFQITDNSKKRLEVMKSFYTSLILSINRSPVVQSVHLDHSYLFFVDSNKIVFVAALSFGAEVQLEYPSLFVYVFNLEVTPIDDNFDLLPDIEETLDQKSYQARFTQFGKAFFRRLTKSMEKSGYTEHQWKNTIPLSETYEIFHNIDKRNQIVVRSMLGPKLVMSNTYLENQISAELRLMKPTDIYRCEY